MKQPYFICPSCTGEWFGTSNTNSMYPYHYIYCKDQYNKDCTWHGYYDRTTTPETIRTGKPL